MKLQGRQHGRFGCPCAAATMVKTGGRHHPHNLNAEGRNKNTARGRATLLAYKPRNRRRSPRVLRLLNRPLCRIVNVVDVET